MVGGQRPLDVLQAVVAAVAAAGAEPDFSGRQGEVVEDDHHVRRPQLVKRHRRLTDRPLRFMYVAG